MSFFIPFVLAALATMATASAVPQELSKRATTSCTTPSGPGFCSTTSSPCTGGTYIAGHCPGASNIQCCVASCSPPSGKGVCEPTANACSGTYYAGFCPGPADIQCCAPSGGGTGSGSLGVDISTTPTASFWTCAAANFKVVALQGYIQGCARGGAVKAGFTQNYAAAKAAGVQRIDAYMFPCTGTQDTGVACKSPAAQIKEFLDVVDANSMAISNYWFDIEPTSTANGGACNAWNLGAAANAQLARDWVAALKATGRKWGIYANGNQWTSMFATRATDIGSDLPLWAVQFDRKPGVNTVTTFMGGWKTAAAKQYNLDTTACGGSVDLDSFL
ncbi:glycoside hydrolase family 25 protein [Amylocarpus encephaloides]|uniref:Glycoside hydrolase family 25 protein n=1 Tax=Amylocarpus encephaloides TaxID=45428 RepID=A0A9P7YND9_9HELO|nr:glycoside hydrolase family 25 protein [Amylocarpus encephaloides]